MTPKEVSSCSWTRSRGRFRLLASGGKGESAREIVELLVGEGNGGAFAQGARKMFAQGGFDLGPGQDDDFAEPGAQGVVNGVVDDDFTVGADGVDLFKAPVATAHSGGKDEKSGLNHKGMSFPLETVGVPGLPAPGVGAHFVNASFGLPVQLGDACAGSA